MVVNIRAAETRDVAAIIAVGRRTWPATYGFAGPAYVTSGLATWWSADAIQQSIQNTTVMVVEDRTAIVATGNIDLRGGHPTIWKLYVVPESQGAGVGSALLRTLLGVAGDRPVRLGYLDGNSRAAAFYAAHGFLEIGREPSGEPGWPATVWVERHPT